MYFGQRVQLEQGAAAAELAAQNATHPPKRRKLGGKRGASLGRGLRPFAANTVRSM